jgi:arylamine N-acetyltransferase
VRDAYLARLGLEPEPPSVDALFRLHRAHVERVPYETLWIHLGERRTVDVNAAMRAIAVQGRGGYCFHLNGALSELLGMLGYNAVRHVGGVHGPAGASAAEMTNHLVVSVRDLPSEANPAGVWYVDAGLGDALHEPLPLVAGDYDQGPFHLVLAETPDGVGDWHLTHDPLGSFTGMAWRSTPAEMAAFSERHAYLSTSPDSGFVRVLTVQRRDGTGVDILRGLTLKRIGASAIDTVLRTKAEFLEALVDLFGLVIDDVDSDARDALWTKLHRAHVEWETAERT